MGKNQKKIFFDETQNLKSLWSQDLTHKIWVKSETKNFFFQRGDPLVFFWFSKNNQRVPPLNRKKIFVSDSTQISCVKSLGHKDCMFWISSKSETKIFFIFKGGTLWCFSDFQGLNMKILINIYGHKWREILPGIRVIWFLWFAKDQNIVLITSYGHLEVFLGIYIA